LFWMITLTVSIVFCFVLFVLVEKPGMLLSEKLRQQIMQRSKKISDPIKAYSQRLDPGNKVKEQLDLVR